MPSSIENINSFAPKEVSCSTSFGLRTPLDSSMLYVCPGKAFADYPSVAATLEGYYEKIVMTAWRRDVYPAFACPFHFPSSSEVIFCISDDVVVSSS